MAEPVSNINDAGSPVTGEDRLNRLDEVPMPDPLPGTPPPDHLLPEADYRSNPRLNAAAEKVGGAMGSAVGSMRRGMRIVGGRERGSGRLGDMADPKGRMADLADSASATVSDLRDSATATVTDLKDSAAEKLDVLKDRATDLSQRASERIGELKNTAGERMSDFGETARNRLYFARRRARYLTNEYPVQTILGFAGLAFVIGFALRIWRSNGD
jgi:ElaB/YqjD/DUF883 family membrane-anchored ribosome-binding protein